MRGFLHNKEWLSVGDMICLRKDEDLHTRAAEMMFTKVINENGIKALDKITAIATDFETGLWRPFLETLNKFKYR